MAPATTGPCGRRGLSVQSLIALAAIIALLAGGSIEQAQAASAGSQGVQASQLQARAAALPLAAIMVCTRLCPVAGGAAARILRRTPKQIKPTRAPKPAVASAFTKAAGSSPSRALGNALAGNPIAAARFRARGLNAHHIVAVKDPRAEFARMVLRLHGVGPNTAANGVWLSRAAHAPIHTNAYYSNVNTVLVRYYFGIPRPKSELLNDLNRIGRLLQKGELPL